MGAKKKGQGNPEAGKRASRARKKSAGKKAVGTAAHTKGTGRREASSKTTKPPRKPRGVKAALEAVFQDGAELLRQAADLGVGKHSAKIAEALTKKAKGGDLASTKLLMLLAEGKKRVLDEQKPRISLADWLVSQLELKAGTEKEQVREQPEKEQTSEGSKLMIPGSTPGEGNSGSDS